MLFLKRRSRRLWGSDYWLGFADADADGDFVAVGCAGGVEVLGLASGAVEEAMGFGMVRDGVGDADSVLAR